MALRPGGPTRATVQRRAGPAVAQARRLIKAYADWQASGVGAFELDGKMVDAPVVKAAEQVLNKARAAGVPV